MSLAAAHRIVVKIGSSLIASDDRDIWLASLAQDVAGLRERGAELVLVSSGAVALGRARLNLIPPLTLDEKQAAAAAGQAALIKAYDRALAPHGITTAQALLTPSDTENRRRWLNARATLATLIRLGAIPIVNENDTVATDELRYGDNDRLAARVAQLVSAEALILLSDVNGLYTADPETDAQARLVPLIETITPEIEAMAGGANARAGVGVGGMASKLAAAKIASAAGCQTYIASGRETRPIDALLKGGPATRVAAQASPARARKAWIAGGLAAHGALHIDAGAAHALTDGASLLTAGLTKVEGDFGKGETVIIRGPDGRELARGLSAYGADEARRIAGLRQDDIEAALGYRGRPVIIHRDDLALMETGPA